MYEIFYRTEVNIICLLILVWIAYRSKVVSDKQTRRMMFQRVILSTIFLMLIDTALIFIEGHTGYGFYIADWILNILYFSMNAVVAFFWALYIIYYIYGNLKFIKIIDVVSCIPIFLYVLITLSSPFSHLIFYIDPDTNLLVKGILFPLQIIITYGFFSASSAVALVSIFMRQRLPSYYHRYVTFFSFVLFPLLGGILHGIFPEAKIVWQGLTLAFLLVYTELQFDLISRDSLTGLNNRRSFDAKLKMIGDYSEEAGSCQNHIFMMDINFFKDINDNYGHPEGDRALITTAELLKHILGKTNAFISRYGGDEFAIIYYCTKEAAGELRIRLYKEFDEFNKSGKCPYRISVSVGYAPVCGAGSDAVKAALKKADTELYTEKEFMHKALAQVDALIRKN